MSIGLEGMKGHTVLVESNVRSEKDQFVIVGLPDASIKESKERILSCIHTLGLDITMKKLRFIFPHQIRGRQEQGTIVPCY